MPLTPRPSLMRIRGNRRRKYRQTTVIKKSLDCKNVEQLNQLEGLKKVLISPLAQKFVGCRIGEEITNDTPWILVDKEKFEDHLEFYEKESDFYPIAEDIKSFPNNKMLIGTHHYNQNEDIEFYICTTLRAQELIMEAIEKEEKAIQQKIYNSMYPTIGIWKSLGSERQIESEVVTSQRPLLIIDLIGNVPDLNQGARFTLRNVENLRDGYMELVTTRQTIATIIRRRLDIAIQASPLKKNAEVQVLATTFCHKNIQSGVDYENVVFSKKLLNELQKFVLNKLLELGEFLKLNFSLNLYNDDYTVLRKYSLTRRWLDSVEIKSYQDVINCRGRKISCFSLNAIISGYVAAAYAFSPNFQLDKAPPCNDEVHETVFEKHLILIWHYSDNVEPKLYLHATRDVTALSFCPYNANILIAGYNNGQIAVWDLRFRLDMEERKVFLTDVQQKNQVFISEHTQWFRRPIGENHVYPTLVSDLGVGHTCKVTSIQWIPPSKFIAPQRMFKDSMPENPHMQFITASNDGRAILVWDLFIPWEDANSKKKKKCIRLTTKPNALLKDISPLKVLKKNFKPVCRLVLSQLNYPLMKLYIRTKMYNYVAKNPKTLDNFEEKTYFTVSEKEGPFEYKQKLLFTTAAGTFHEATWEESDYDPRFFAIDEKCHLDKFVDIHDGPILVCEVNPILEEVILTIGGSVYAIWCPRIMRLPIFWRKCKLRYVTGMWSQLHPLAFITVRCDTFYEVWNIFEKSEVPMQLIKYKGYKLTKLYKDTSRSHVRKKTCVLTVITGAFKLYTVPSEEIEITEADNDIIQQAQDFLEHLVAVKQATSKMAQNYRKSLNIMPEIQVEVKDEKRQLKEISAQELVEQQVPLSKEKQWEMKNHNSMRKILLEKKKLNLKEIAKNKLLIEDILNEDKVKEKKFHETKVRKDAIFNKTRGRVLKQKSDTKSRRYSFKGDAKSVKETYFNDFLTIEKEMMDVIRQKDYCFEYNWATVYLRHREKYRELQC